MQCTLRVTFPEHHITKQGVRRGQVRHSGYRLARVGRGVLPATLRPIRLRQFVMPPSGLQTEFQAPQKRGFRLLGLIRDCPQCEMDFRKPGIQIVSLTYYNVASKSFHNQKLHSQREST